MVMDKLSVTHSSFVIERSYPTTPERVFAAFADPAKKRKWFAESDGGSVREFEMDFRVGGSESSRSKMPDGTPPDGGGPRVVGPPARRTPVGGDLHRGRH